MGRTLRHGLVVVVITLATSPLGAQRAESPSSQLFPAPARVIADYPDDPQRWAALSALYFAAQERLPDGQYKASYEKSTGYFQAFENIQLKYDHPRQPTPADLAFHERINQLRTDPVFRRQVLDRYRISTLPTGAAKPAGPVEPAKSPETLLQEALPWWMATIVVMWLVARPIIRMSGGQPLPPAPPQTGPIGLPESLRVISVPWRKYAIEVDSGQVIEVKTWTETTVSSYTTPGSVQQIGDQVFVTPDRHGTSVSTVRKDQVWLRDTSAHENSWTLTGGVLDVRAGHVLSRIGGRWGGSLQFIMACNHTTGQFVSFPSGFGLPHGTGGGLKSWFLAVVVGTIGWVWGGWSLVPLINPEESIAMNAIGFTIEGLIGSAIIAAIIVFRVSSHIVRQRDKVFRQQYVPQIKEFLEHASPTVVAAFKA